MIRGIAIIVLVGFCSACSPATAPKTPVSNTATNVAITTTTTTTMPVAAPKSAVGQIIDDMTGKTTVDAGQRAKATIRRVNAKEKAQYDEIQNSQ